MDAPSDDTLQVTFSFDAGTFDLQKTCPEWCFETEDGRYTVVRLDRRFEQMFGSLREFGMVLASSSSGLLSMKDVWLNPTFLSIPESDVLIEVETGCEIHCSAVNSALAVVEDLDDQQLASLQLLDSTGRCVLKLALTSGSNLSAFERLVKAHVGNVPPRQRVIRSLHPSAILSSQPDAALVRSLWSGLLRTSPENGFPGMEGVSRHTAVSVAGPDLAWPVSNASVKEALDQTTLCRVPLSGILRNDVVMLPAAFRPFEYYSCTFGSSWFSDLGQISLLAADSQWQAWAVRHAIASHECIGLEFYDAENRFCGSLGLHPDATEDDRRGWTQALAEPSVLPTGNA